MFVINDDMSIYATRGDTVFFTVAAEEDGVPYEFKAGDVLRMKIYGKKDAENVVLEKNFPVTSACKEYTILLDEDDTKIGEIISKPTDYWYEVELNPFTNPQTIIGYDEDGAKIFKLFPEGADSEESEVKPEDIPVIDDELDLSSNRPVENRAVSRAIVNLEAAYRETKEEVKAEAASLNAKASAVSNEVAVERARIDNLVSGATADDAELIDVRVGADGVTYASAGEAVRGQFLTTADVYNVTHKKPLDGQYYTPATAVGAVPMDARRAGMIITFRPTYERWETYQYTVKDVSDTNWNNLSYWKNITYASELHNLYRGVITELGYSSFEECTDYGYYRFLTADVVNITDAPSNLTRAGNLYVYPFFGGAAGQFIRDLDGNEWFRHSGIDWICTNYKNEARLTALEDAVAEIKNSSIKWCALGDSITQGYYSYIDSEGNVAYALDNEKGWAKQMSTITGYTLFNKAVGGSGYLSIRTAESPVDNAKTVADATDFSQFDLVTLAFGVNDWKYNCVLGSMADSVFSGGSIYSNMKYVIEKILNDNPLCKIVVITPINSCSVGDYNSNWGLGYSFSNNGTLEDIFNAIVEVCEWYGIEYIDMTHSSVVNRHNIKKLLIDGVHPSAECHIAMAKELAKKINF